MVDELEEMTLTERLVLLGLVRQVRHDEAPTTSAELLTVCQACLDGVDADVVGRLTEADVTRALNTLATNEFVEEAMQQRSPVGKGRPTYTLRTDVDSTLSALSADERLAPLVADFD